MTAEYPKMLYAPKGKGSVTVRDAAEEAKLLEAGFLSVPGDAHREGPRFHAPDVPVGAALTEAHIPLIVEQVTEAVFDRLKDMALAAASEPGAREAAEGVAALGESLEARFGVLQGELVNAVSALIAPAPSAPAGGKRS